MATIDNNGTITYSLNGTSNQLQSNTVSTSLNITYAASVLKTASPEEFSPGDVIKYQIRVSNSGTGSLYLPQISDDLGGTSGTSTYLTYYTDSAAAVLYNNTAGTSENVDVTAALDNNALKFTFGDLVIPGNSDLVVTYWATADSTISASVLNITNTATLSANEGSATGATVTETASGAISRTTVTMVKSADKTEVSPGDTLNYVFTLTNSTAYPATLSNLTDNLPENFEIGDTITASIGGTAVTYTKGTDYTVSDSNQLVLSPASASTQLTIPAATDTASGVTTITNSGTVSA